MRLALLAGADRKNEVIRKEMGGLHQLYWVESVEQFSQLKDIDAYFDFDFVNDIIRTEALAKYLPKPVFVNSVTHTIESIGQPFIRFNGWPGFFERSLIEISASDPASHQLAETIFNEMNWSFQVTKDIPGMISARIISMIINEAYFTFQDEISTKDEIDTAMKLGTNYPYGPFEWSRKIGLRNIHELLVELRRTNELYSIATALEKDLLKDIMALLLSIDTATEVAGICLSLDGSVLAISKNAEQKDHASWLHVAIDELLEHAGYALADVNAIAISAGPGSYTGLRVGMAAAKGLCYALKIPLIMENTLMIMAFACSEQMHTDDRSLICPMIDARRDEVFMALFSRTLEELLAPRAEILNKNSFDEWFSDQRIVFLGSGTAKWTAMNTSPNASFIDTPFIPSHLSTLAHRKFLRGEFTDIIYAEPVYLKEFYTHVKK